MLCDRNVREVWLRDELKKWSSHLLDNLSDCLICIPEKFQRDSNPRPLRCRCSALTNWTLKPLRCEQVNLLGSCLPVKGMMSEWNVCEVWLRDELKKWSSNLLDNLSDYLICVPEKFQVSLTGFKTHDLTASASQRSWVRIPLKIPETFQTIAEIVQQVWRSLLEFKKCFVFLNVQTTFNVNH